MLAALEFPLQYASHETLLLESGLKPHRDSLPQRLLRLRVGEGDTEAWDAVSNGWVWCVQ